MRDRSIEKAHNPETGRRHGIEKAAQVDRAEESERLGTEGKQRDDESMSYMEGKNQVEEVFVYI